MAIDIGEAPQVASATAKHGSEIKNTPKSDTAWCAAAAAAAVGAPTHGASSAARSASAAIRPAGSSSAGG